MKQWMPLTLGTAMLWGATLAADTLPPGQVDFGSFSPPGGGGEFVEVNVSSAVIGLAAKFVEKEEPDIARLLNGLKLVHVNVIGMDEENRLDLGARIAKLRKELEGKGWEKVVVAQQRDQNVGVYLKTRDKDTVQGLVVLAVDGNKAAVFVNVVGDIRPEQLSTLGERLHIDPLKNIGQHEDK
jgi:hypothetical protein